MMNMRDHVKDLGAMIVSGWVTHVDFTKKPFSLTLNNAQQIKAESVIIATGATPKRLGCPGENEYWGRGVTTCAVCDGAFYKGLPVIIVGGGDTAMEDASFMTNFTDNITIVHILDRLTATAAMQERVLNNPKIKIIYTSTVTEIKGNGKQIIGVTITNQKNSEKSSLAVNAVFIAIGLSPNTAIFKGQLELDTYGNIVARNHTHTSIPGIFCAGDVADPRYRQAITSAGSGCMAALDAERYLKEHEKNG